MVQCRSGEKGTVEFYCVVDLKCPCVASEAELNFTDEFLLRKLLDHPVQAGPEELQAGESEEHPHGPAHGRHNVAGVVQDHVASVVDNVGRVVHPKEGLACCSP